MFYGENGSGKTSLLEAVYHLGFARSFRTSLLSRLVREGHEGFSVFGEVGSVPVGIERDCKGHFCIRLQREDIRSAAELAKVFPLQLINHTVYHLIDLGPKERRRFIDWGVFHVEHQVFLSLWKKLHRLLKQRNSALRIRPVSKKSIELWDAELVETAELITQLRRQYLDQLEPVLLSVIKRLLQVDNIRFVFCPGWEEKQSFQKTLSEALEGDLTRGYTRFGPHHADLRICTDKISVRDVLSRGQQKLLACSMRLAQAVLLKEQKGKQSVFLIDDLASELDEHRMRVVCEFLSELQTQVFLTCTREQTFDGLFEKKLTKRFHVEHGTIMEEEVV